MHLITLAHLGEAQSIIERYQLQRVSPHFYQGENFHCLITGEGPFEAAIATTEALTKTKYQKVINLGIAGSLDAHLSVGAILKVRTIYLAIDGKPQFKSFACDGQGLDLVTSFERVLSTQKAEPLKGVAKLVDREAWGVAMAAKAAGVSLGCYKLISDQAGTLEACEVVREKAEEYSSMLADFLPQLLVLPVSQEKIQFSDQLKDFYFTFTSQKKFEATLRKLSLREEMSELEVLSSLPLSVWKEMKLTPKDRTRLLQEEMDKRLDPFKGQLESKLKHWKEPFSQKQIDLQTDPSWESDKIKISMEISQQSELQEKLKILSTLDLTSYQNLREGKINVE